MNHKYDLEARTFKFTKAVLEVVNDLHKTLANVEIAKQVIRSSGSVGANYIEANESLSRKDFIYRIKICRKKAKEITYWLKLLDIKESQKSQRKQLIKESVELTNIFGAIYRKSGNV